MYRGGLGGFSIQASPQVGKNKSNTQILFLDLADKWGLFSRYLSFAFVCA